MKVSARDARRFLEFWALGFTENLGKPRENEGFWRAKRTDFQVKTLAWNETLVKP